MAVSMRKQGGDNFVGWSSADAPLQSTKDNAIEGGNELQLLDKYSIGGMDKQMVELTEGPIEATAYLLRLKNLFVMPISSDIAINPSEASLEKPESNAPL